MQILRNEGTSLSNYLRKAYFNALHCLPIKVVISKGNY